MTLGSGDLHIYNICDSDNTWNEKFGWFEMFNRIYNLSHATGADGTEAFKSKLKFQIQHEVFR